MSVSPALRILRQEDHEFKASLGYIVISCLKTTTTNPKMTTTKQKYFRDLY
jgi:hypothetical protein